MPDGGVSIAGPRRLQDLRKRGPLGPEDDVEATVETQRPPARPGTPETGRPNREDIGRSQRDDLKQNVSGDQQPPEDMGPSPQGPASEEYGRMDRKELTGQRAQDDTRSDGDETDTQGGQKSSKPRADQAR